MKRLTPDTSVTAVASAIFEGINFTGIKMASVKPFKTIDEQLQILRSRGLCGEDATIVHALKTIGYYRLSGYSFFFKEDEEKFKENYSKNYLDLPPWMLVNIIDFGTTVTIYKGLPRQLKKKTSEPVGLTY